MDTVCEGARSGGSPLSYRRNRTPCRKHAQVWKRSLGTGYIELCRMLCASIAACNGFNVVYALTECALVGEGLSVDDTARASAASKGLVYGQWMFRAGVATGAIARVDSDSRFVCYRKSVTTTATTTTVTAGI